MMQILTTAQLRGEAEIAALAEIYATEADEQVASETREGGRGSLSSAARACVGSVRSVHTCSEHRAHTGGPQRRRQDHQKFWIRK